MNQMHLKNSGSKGLSGEEAKTKLLQYGYNELVKKKENKDLQLLLRQITQNPIVYILIIAALLSYITEEMINFAVILLVITYVVFVGFFQERKAERAMEALKALIKPESRVMREGRVSIIPAREIVPGDVLVLDMGDKIPADGVVFNGLSVRIDESALSGESLPVHKENGGQVFAATQLVYGKCNVLVEKTGMQTKMGKIAELIQQNDEETPLQKKINTLVKNFAMLTLLFLILFIALGLRDPDVHHIEFLILALALAVASVPEGLPLVLTTALALGMNKLAEKNAIIRKLSAVETLGSVTVICTDKTGTLTKNEMVVEKIFFDNTLLDVTGNGYEPEGNFLHNGKTLDKKTLKDFHVMLKAAVLCNNSFIEKKNGSWQVVGDPTEGALVSMAAKYGFFKEDLDKKHPKIHENFFTSERKMMSTVHASDGEKISFAKGAPEVILANCSSIFEGGKTRKMTDGDNARIAGLLEEFSRKSLRVIAFSFNDSQKAINKDEQEKGMVFCGLAAMADPPREEVKDALEACRRGGIRVVMITGDNPNTAKAVGERIGLLDERSSVLTGADIDKFGEKEFEKVVREVNVFARTHPEHKLRIVNALRSQGEIVAMTGDGVNDAPALKRADIGIAMGIKGTDVSKEASDMVLSDDNFASIVEAVRNGRAIYENIQKTTAFIISRNYAEVFLLLITTLFLGVEYTPLVALQILFINLIDEEIPAFVLASDTPRKGIMNDRPRNPKEGILPSRLLALIFGLSIFTAIMVYGVYLASDPANDLTLARTVAFAAIISCVIFNTLSFKSLEEPLSLREAFSNRMLLLAIFGSLLLGLAAIYHPALQSIFHTTSLGMPHLIMAVLVGASTTIFIEAGKHLLKMLSNNKGNAIGQTINLVKQ